jgi:hypothetical protein
MTTLVPLLIAQMKIQAIIPPQKKQRLPLIIINHLRRNLPLNLLMATKEKVERVEDA